MWNSIFLPPWVFEAPSFSSTSRLTSHDPKTGSIAYWKSKHFLLMDNRMLPEHLQIGRWEHERIFLSTFDSAVLELLNPYKTITSGD